ACEEVEASYGLVETLFEEMAEFTVRLREYAKVEVGDAMRKKVVATLACMLEIIGRSEELIRTKRFRHFIGVTWVGKDEKTRDALDRFHKLIDSEERLVVAVTYSSVQNTEHNVSTLLSAANDSKQSQEDILEKVGELSTVVTNEKEQELLKDALWTQAIPRTSEIFAEFKESMLEGTCEWLHDEFLFHAWENRETSLLWVFGGPGAGKSFLATKTILFLRDQHDQDPQHPSKTPVSYFYIKEDNQALHNLNVILKSIAYQIVQKDENYKRYVLSVCRSAEAINTADKTWKALFLNFYTSTEGAESSAFVVIDGLDEAPLDTRRKLLDLLRVLVNPPPGSNHNRVSRLQIAIFGRPDLRDDMEFFRQKFVNVNAQKNRKDINDYILSRLPLIRVLKDMKPKARTKFAKEIRDTILQRADGMFFWAKLVLDQICRKERKSEVQQALQNAPRELDRMIRHVFGRVAADPDVNVADLNKILSWVTCARRPLTLGELHTILKLPTGEPNLLLRRRLSGKFASFINMSKLGGGEVEEEDGDMEPGDVVAEENVDEAPLGFSNLSDDSDDGDDDGDDSDAGSDNIDGAGGESGGGKIVTPRKDEFAIDERAKVEFRTIEVSFSHKRIKDYLVQEGGSNPIFAPPEFPKMSIGINVNESELELALTCLAILVDGITEDEGEFDLIQYAAQNFMKHIGALDRSKISKRDKQKLLEQIIKLFYDDAGLRKLLRTTREDDSIQYGHFSHEYRQKNTFYHTWIGTNEHSKVLREFLREVDTVGANNFTAGQLDWMDLSMTSAKEFYRPLMTVSSNNWLTKTGWDDIGYLVRVNLDVWLLHGFFMMNDDGSQDEGVEVLSIHNRHLSTIPLERMRIYSEWAGLEKTAHWHVGLGCVMKGGLYYDAANLEFKKALKIDSLSWVAQEELSSWYTFLGNTNLALEWMEKAMTNVPSAFNLLVQNTFLPQIAELLGKTGNSDRAIKAWRAIWENDKHNTYHLGRYICELQKGGQYQDLAAIITEINALTSDIEIYKNLLIELISSGDDEVFNAIGVAVNNINATSTRTIFLGACTITISAIDAIRAVRTRSVWSTQIRMVIASFRYLYCNQTSEAIELWQQTIDLINKFAAVSYLATQRTECSNAIGQILFDTAVEAKEKGENPASWIDSLKDHARVATTELVREEYYGRLYSMGYSSMIYVVWLRDYGGAEEAVWKKCFHATVLRVVDTLLDDPDDSQMAWDRYFYLGSKFLMADDMPNATTSFAVAMRRHQDQSIVNSDAAEAKEATQPGRIDLKGETPQLSGGSMPAGGPTEHLEEYDTKSSYPQGGTF
ncbi:hypothetical protein V491_07872, partial [Pseudogymnoascus sp. VKM F-3775]